MSTRRGFLLHTGLASVALATTPLGSLAYEEDLWATASQILRRMRAPEFSSRAFDVTTYGARPDAVQSPDVLEGVKHLVLKNVRVNSQRRDETLSR
jgi:hypothetical protein